MKRPTEILKTPAQARIKSDKKPFITLLVRSKMIIITPNLTFQGRAVVCRTFSLTLSKRLLATDSVVHKESRKASTYSLFMALLELTISKTKVRDIFLATEETETEQRIANGCSHTSNHTNILSMQVLRLLKVCQQLLPGLKS